MDIKARRADYNDDFEYSIFDRAEVRARNKFADVLANFPPLRERIIAPAALSLVDAVSLIALFVASRARCQSRVLRPLGTKGSTMAYSRAWRTDPTLHSILRNGFATIAPRTPSRHVRIHDGQPAIDFTGVYWQPAPAFFAQVTAIMEAARRPRWPERWVAEVLPLAYTMANEELGVMTIECASWFGWPAPNNTEVIHEFMTLVLEHESLSMAMRCLLDGGEATEAARTNGKVTEPCRWSNRMIEIALRTLKRHISGKRELPIVRRRMQRTAVDVALWDRLLSKQDAGYDTPLSEISFPT